MGTSDLLDDVRLPFNEDLRFIDTTVNLYPKLGHVIDSEPIMTDGKAENR
jgi:hypothetical protein